MAFTEEETQRAMVSMGGLLTATVLVFYAAFGDKDITWNYFIVGMLIAFGSLLYRFSDKIMKR
jgi:hypothetical protein